MDLVKKYLPIFQWLPNYNKSYFSGDLAAGLTVGIMLIPQGIAYAIIADLPPIYGLYASMIPQVMYAIFGTSRQLAVGPVAMDSLIVAAGVSTMAVAGTNDYIQLAIALALLMGIIQLIFGLLRMGFLVNFLSKPVISGFTSAAALIIGLNQLKHLLGVDIERSNQVHKLVYNAIQHIGEINWSTFAIGITSIIIIKVLKKYAKKVPAALVVVVFGILVVYSLRLDLQGVKIVKEIPTGLPSPSLPTFDYSLLSELIPIAFTLAMIAFMEAISVAKAVEEKHSDYKVDANQELIALGMGNIVGSFFKSYPTTGGFSRTAVNDQAGAKTGVSAIIAASIVALTLLFLTPLFYYLPKSVLAAIIMVAVFGLIDFKLPSKLWKYKKDDLLMLIITFIVTLTIGIKEGIMTGVGLSVVLLVYRTSKPHIAVLGKIKGTDYFKNIERFDNAEHIDNIAILRLDSQLFFANTSYFKDNVEELIKSRNENINYIIINAEAINMIDSTAILMLDHLIDELKDKNIQLVIAGAIGPVRDILNKSELIDKIGVENMFAELSDAVKHLSGEKEFTNKHIANQVSN